MTTNGQAPILPGPARDLDEIVREQFGPAARVTGFLDAKGRPIDPDAPGDPDPPPPASVTITVRDPDAFLDAFASVFNYRDQVPDLTNPRRLIPNPTSREAFAAAILRAYCDQIVRLARERREAEPEGGL